MTPDDAQSQAPSKLAVDFVAQAIRTADGDHTMGAGALAEVVTEAMAEWLNLQATAYIQDTLAEMERSPQDRELLGNVATDVNNSLLLAADWMRGKHVE